MLKVNSTSSASGGSGNTTMASTASTPTGTPKPLRMMSRVVSGWTCSICYLGLGHVDLRRRRPGAMLADRGADLEDVRQHPGHGRIQARRNLVTDLHAAMQGAGQRRRLEDRNLVFGSYFTDSQGHEVH